MQHPQSTLHRLQQAAVDLAVADLARAVEAEDAAWQARNRADAAIADAVRDAACSSDDAAVEGFGAWLKGARARLETAELQAAEAAVVTSHRRAQLSLARGAAARATPPPGAASNTVIDP